MQELKKILKMLNSELFYKILKISKLDEREYNILRDFILRENKRDEVCINYHISRSTFRDIKNSAMLKIKIALTNLLDEKINQIGN